MFRRTFQVLLIIVTLSFPSNYAFAEDFYCEVMSVHGTAVVKTATNNRSLTEGELLKPGDLVEVADDSYVDLAYDKEWQNVTRFFENSRVTIRSLYPTDLKMDYGDILAKLDALPKNSTFEIETPTAIAAVRGSAFETIYRDGETSVKNLHDSTVYVFGLDEHGNMAHETHLAKFEKTDVRPLESPSKPEKMSERDIQHGTSNMNQVNQNAAQIQSQGRQGKLEDIRTIRTAYQKGLQERIQLANESFSRDVNASDQNFKELANLADRITLDRSGSIDTKSDIVTLNAERLTKETEIEKPHAELDGSLEQNIKSLQI